MTDRELLELAAKAAGRQIRWDGNVAVLLDYEPGVDDCSAWHPLTDDGDALRLAVNLRLEVSYHEELAQAFAVIFTSGREFAVKAENCKGGEFAATRRAIVRAAAEVGKTK